MSDCMLIDRPPSIRDILRKTMRGLHTRSCAALIGAATLMSLSLAGRPARRRSRRPATEAEHRRHHGRRHRHLEHRRLPSRHDGGPHAEPRQDRRRGHAVHRLLRRSELHGGPRQLHHRPVADPHRHDHRRPGRRADRPAGGGADDRHRAQGAWAMPRASSARTISATRTSSCRRCTASTSSSATSITSTRWRTPAIRTIRRISGRRSARATWSARSATNVDDATVDPRWGKVGKQKIEDAGELCPKRMETVDDEIRDHALKFLDKAKADNKPFFLWLNPTRMHIVTHLSPKYQEMRNSKNGWTIHEAGMAQLDDDIGLVMKKLTDMGVDNNTIVIFTTDNGTEVFTWPDGGQTPFAQSKGTIMEGGFRAPAMIRWPGKVPAGKVENGIISGLDWFPTFLAAAGNPNIVEELKKGKQIGDRTYKVHLDGYNQTDMITGKGPSNRNEIFYFGESTLGAVRIGDYKYRFIDQPGGWLGDKTKVDVPVPDQPASRSVRAHGLAGERDQGRRAAVFPVVQVRVLALRVRPAAGREARDDGGRVSADAKGRELQSRRREGADRGRTSIDREVGI